MLWRLAPAIAQEPAGPRHAIAMYGEPALGADFPHFPYARSDAPKAGRITLGHQGSFDGMNQLAIRGTAPPVLTPYIVQSLMFRSLDEPFTLYPLIAESIETAPDRSWVVFRLNPKATFSDGKPLTSADVLFSWDLLKRKGRPNHRSYYSKVSSATAPDAHTVRFAFSGPPDRELPLIFGLMPVFAKHATDPEKFEQMGFAPLVGSGPYLLADLEPGARLTLKRRADYWAADLPSQRGFYNFDEIRLEYFRDSNAMLEAFRTGLYDFRVELDPTKWLTAYDSPALRDGRFVKEGYAFETPPPLNAFILNTRRGALSDPRVRQALGQLFDFEWMNANLFRGVYRRSAGYFGNSELSSVGKPPTDIERRLLEPFAAQIPPDVLEGRWKPPVSDGSGRDRAVIGGAVKLLDAAGYKIRDGRMVHAETGRPFTFAVMVNNRDKERIALAFADTLKLVGIHPSIRLVDTSEYWSRLKSFDFDVVVDTYFMSASPGNEQENRWSSSAARREASLNYPGVASPAVDAMIKALLAARQKDEYVAAVRALDRALIAGFYVIPLYHAPERWVARWTRIGRPERLPRFDFTPDVWWRNEP
jgi:peptide/nickel transport system substrate-binding protein